jgi:ABC-type glycerol-3-phosphate transport system permease component
LSSPARDIRAAGASGVRASGRARAWNALAWNALAWGLALLFSLPVLGLVYRAVAGGMFTFVLQRTDYLRGVGNSLFLACATVMASVTLSSLSGFVLGAYRFAGRGLLMVGLMALAGLPPQLFLPGGYELVVRLGLFDSYGAVVLPGLLSVLSVLMFQAAYGRVPREMLEAARVDGASEWGIWWRVAFPAVRPTTAACLMLAFAGNFNAVVWPTIVLQSRALQTLPTGLTALTGTVVTRADQSMVLAGTVLALVPVMALFLLLQRDFLPGLTRGSGK